MIKDQIIKAIQKAGTALIYTEADIVKRFKSSGIRILSEVPLNAISIEFSDNLSFGDYTTNFPMSSYRQMAVASNSHVPGGKKEGAIWANLPYFFHSPVELAQKIVEKLIADQDLMEVVEKIEVAGPGFINFWLTRGALVTELEKIEEEKEKYGKSDSLKGKKIMLEYGDANTHKLPHIGHLFSYTYGESMCRILDFAGGDVRKVCYQGDIGLHVAKCLWAYQKENPEVPEKLDDKVQLLQKMYQEGSRAFDEEEKAKLEITNLNKAIYDQDPRIVDLWKTTRQWSIDYYKKFEDELGVSYDRNYYESEVYKKGQEIVESNEGGVFTRSEGALIFEGSKYGLHDRVFITKYGTPTYEAKDMYLQELKMQEWPMDLLIITTAFEQNAYFDVIFKALETLNKKYIGKLKHIGFGMINLKSGKMSSRTGEILGAVDVVEKIKELSKKQSPDEEVSQKVAIGAIKYSFLKNNPLQSIAFDLEGSVAKEGNSGPYLQYTVARCNSVLNKFSKSVNQLVNKLENDKWKMENEEELVLRTLTKFAEVVEQSAKSYSPNLLCNYLYDLAQKYNGFYNKDKIIGGENEGFRLALTSATGQVLKNGLKLLGIEAPERM
jgi:arginyl-tRNA synthetase